jgi:hypothetical protein
MRTKEMIVWALMFQVVPWSLIETWRNGTTTDFMTACVCVIPNIFAVTHLVRRWKATACHRCGVSAKEGCVHLAHARAAG